MSLAGDFSRWVLIKLGFLIREYHDLRTAVNSTRVLGGKHNRMSITSSSGKFWDNIGAVKEKPIELNLI